MKHTVTCITFVGGRWREGVLLRDIVGTNYYACDFYQIMLLLTGN